MNAETPAIYLLKIQTLMAHNLIFIESGLAQNITYVLQGMGSDEIAMQEGFLELQFWLDEGLKGNQLPPVFHTHIMRYVTRGIRITHKGEVA